MIEDRAYHKTHGLFGCLLIRRMLGDELHKSLDAELLSSGQMSLYDPVSIKQHFVTGLEAFGGYRRFTDGIGGRSQAPGYGRLAVQFPDSRAAAYEDGWWMPSVRPRDRAGIEFDTREKTGGERRTAKLLRDGPIKGSVHFRQGAVLSSIVTV